MKLTTLGLSWTGILIFCASAFGGEVPVQDQHLIAMDQLLARVKMLKLGSVISAELEDKAGRPVYELQTRDMNHLRWEILVDAKSGKVIGKNQR